MPYGNSCRSLRINVMKLVNISKDGHFYWLSFEIWISTVAFILRKLQAFLWAMLRPICEAYQPLMTILCIFYMLNIDGFWHGTLKKGWPLMSRNITIYDLDFCAKIQLSWMIKMSKYPISSMPLRKGFWWILTRFLGVRRPFMRLLFIRHYPKNNLLKFSGQNLSF